MERLTYNTFRVRRHIATEPASAKFFENPRNFLRKSGDKKLYHTEEWTGLLFKTYRLDILIDKIEKYCSPCNSLQKYNL